MQVCLCLRRGNCASLWCVEVAAHAGESRGRGLFVCCLVPRDAERAVGVNSVRAGIQTCVSLWLFVDLFLGVAVDYTMS